MATAAQCAQVRRVVCAVFAALNVVNMGG